jgi:hypothetical protein
VEQEYSIFFIVRIYVVLSPVLSHTVHRYARIAMKIVGNLLLAVIDNCVYFSQLFFFSFCGSSGIVSWKELLFLI